MAEPLGVAASVIGIAQLAATIVSLGANQRIAKRYPGYTRRDPAAPGAVGTDRIEPEVDGRWERRTP